MGWLSGQVTQQGRIPRECIGKGTIDIMALGVFKKILPFPVKCLIKALPRCLQIDDYAHFSWSQEGEDMILRKLFENKSRGFYVDVGAHHPERFSNTNYFYKKGWTGINIDAAPGCMELFNQRRKLDINLEVGVGEREETADFYIFNDPALNGFLEDVSNLRNAGQNKYEIIKTSQVKLLPLAKILKDNLEPEHKIDFLSIDVEGMDEVVLKSNDWDLFRPSCVVVEILAESLNELLTHPIVKFMNVISYEPYAKSGKSIIFVERSLTA